VTPDADPNPATESPAAQSASLTPAAGGAPIAGWLGVIAMAATGAAFGAVYLRRRRRPAKVDHSA
jgi:hypothetical protein